MVISFNTVNNVVVSTKIALSLKLKAQAYRHCCFCESEIALQHTAQRSTIDFIPHLAHRKTCIKYSSGGYSELDLQYISVHEICCICFSCIFFSADILVLLPFSREEKQRCTWLPELAKQRLFDTQYRMELRWKLKLR